jgi:hypothetical protein
MRRFVLLLPLLFLAPSVPSSPRTASPSFSSEGLPSLSYPLPEPYEMEELARRDPVAFLENCLRHYESAVTGYTATMLKRERIGGTLHHREALAVWFNEQPFSVLLVWKAGARNAERALYVDGANDGKNLVRPTGLWRSLLGDVVAIDPEGAQARQAGRYSLREYGLKRATQRTLRSWQDAQRDGILRAEYLGKRKVREAGDRTCLVLRRPHPDRPETADQVSDVTIYVDAQTWLQVGSVLKNPANELVGEYYFRDVRLNPAFAPNQFTREMLKP